MEQDRFQQHSVLYIICMICMMLSLTLFAFSFYIVPRLFWNWLYNIPGFIPMWVENFKDSYSITELRAKMYVFLIFFIPAIITGIICFITSNKIENEIQGITPARRLEESPMSQDFKETVSFSIKLILLILLVLVLVFFVEWLIVPNF